jgi:hypothetical protein
MLPDVSNEVLQQQIANAELIREVVLKCISFNGLPRTINALTFFRNALPQSVQDGLSNSPNRETDAHGANWRQVNAEGRQLWDNIYGVHTDKLLTKLGESHPDLPGIILSHHYSPLLSQSTKFNGQPTVGRILTSVVAIACLRTQTGSAPQVESHVYGLRAAFNSNFAERNDASSVGSDWLGTDNGCTWVIEAVDSIIRAFDEAKVELPNKTLL